MPDDPKKRGKQDRIRLSKQQHEQRYAPKRKTPPKVVGGGSKKK